MTEEDRRTDNGGAIPSADKEYRDDARYSVRSVPENPPHEGQKNGGSDKVAGLDLSRLGESFAPKGFEGISWDDSALGPASENKPQKKRNYRIHNIKIGGIYLTPKRILILCGFFLVVLICIGSCIFYALKDYGKYRNFMHARAVFETGDYETAKGLFIKVINDDPNKEEALKAMADIYHHYGDWGNEAFFRQRVMRLNPLNKDYLQIFLKSAFRARAFGSIYSILNLKIMENSDLSPEEGALFLIAALHTGQASNGKRFHDDKVKENPAYFSDTEYGRYAELLLNASDINREKAWNIIASLPKIEDEQIRFETINTLLLFFSKQRTQEADEQMEKLLLESVELNEYAGAPLLADFYFAHYRFDDLIKVCEEFFKTKMNALMPVLYGEGSVLSGREDLIPPLADRIRYLSGRQSKILASYLDALYAFTKGDETRLRSAMLEAGTSIETPLSVLMRFQLALADDSPKEVQQQLISIMRNHPFLDFQQRARTAALEYLLKQAESNFASDPDRLSVCADIAALIQTPGDDVSFLKRIILLDHFKRGLLNEDEISSALEDYPDDPVLLRIAAEYYLTRGQVARAMDCITAFNSLQGVESQDSMIILHILALDQMGRKEEAEKEFRTLVERDEDMNLLYLYYDFCIENKLFDSLRSLSAWIESLPKDSAKRAALPFVQAELLLADGKEDQALSLFEKTPSNDPRFVFHAATRLAEAGRKDAALKRYHSIRETSPDKKLVNINLSSLYQEKGDAKNALACARTAWDEDQNDLLARYIYGKRLFEAGKYADAVSVLKFPQFKASFPEEMLDLWAKAIREQIKADFASGRYTPTIEKAKHLLIYFPEDELGLDYVDRVQKIRRHETTGGDGR